MEKTLSVSIAAYNVEKYLEETLNSLIIKDNLEHIEVLIISDGSTDRTEKIALKYESLYPGVFKLIKKENGGWGSTVNVGLKNSSGKYFKQLDGDDYYDTKNLDSFVGFLNSCDEDMILSPFISFDDKSHEIIDSSYVKEFNGISFPTILEELTEQYKGMNMHAACFKTSLLKDNNLKIEEHCFYTDVDLMVQACSFVRSVNYFPQAIYCYRTSRDGQSCSIDGYIKHYSDHYKISLKCLENAYKYNSNEKIKKMIIDRCEIMVAFQYFIAIFSNPSKELKRSIIEFDDIIRNKYPLSYEHLNSYRRIKVLRQFHFHILPILHRVCSKEN